MQRDRQIVVVVAPQLMEQHLGLRARIDEDQRHAMRLDRLRRSRAAHSAPSARPRAARHSESRMAMSARAPSPATTISASRVGALPLMRHQKGGKLVGPRHRRRQADRRQARANACAAAPDRAPADRRACWRRARAARRGSTYSERAEQLGRAFDATASARSAPAWSAECRAAGWRWRARREGGVSPVRVSSLIGSPISATGIGQIARDVDGERLERRDIERVDGGRRLSLRRRRGKIDQARQKTGQRLAAAGRRDQQRVAPRAGMSRAAQLVRMRAPAARPEPAGKRLGQRRAGAASTVRLLLARIALLLDLRLPFAPILA